MTYQSGHPIHRLSRFEIVVPYTLRVTFEDEVSRVIDFRPMLAGDLFKALQDQKLFDQVEIDPAALHDRPEHVEAMKTIARKYGWKWLSLKNIRC